MADYFNSLRKLVISASLEKPEWSKTTIVRTSAIAEIQRQKEQAGKNILVVGSYKLVQALMRENLIDEYKLYVYPRTLGNGKRLFEHEGRGQRLKLKVAKQFISGVLSVTYQTEK